jgi:hypothetical protein
MIVNQGRLGFECRDGNHTRSRYVSDDIAVSGGGPMLGGRGYLI